MQFVDPLLRKLLLQGSLRIRFVQGDVVVSGIEARVALRAGEQRAFGEESFRFGWFLVLVRTDMLFLCFLLLGSVTFVAALIFLHL